jgi:hypothetical protein
MTGENGIDRRLAVEDLLAGVTDQVQILLDEMIDCQFVLDDQDVCHG